jgi:sigma-B regulation protein RsbU (phosphoserine phosphatase)
LRFADRPYNLEFRISGLRTPLGSPQCANLMPMRLLSRLNWLQRITLILFVLVMANWITSSTVGYALIGGDLFTFLFVISVCLLALTLIGPIVRKIVWRVRNRLLVTYFFVGVLPILLMVLFVCLGFYLVLGQTVNYLVKAELERRTEQVYNSAERLAQDTAAGRPRSGVALPSEEVIIRTDSRNPDEFPAWSKPGFKGIITGDDGAHFFAAHAAAAAGGRRAEVFAYQTFDKQTLADLAPGLASILLVTGERIQVRIGKFEEPKATHFIDSEDIAPPPGSRGFWDLALESPLPQVARSMRTGRTIDEAFVIRSRPSAVLTKLFSTLGSIAKIIGLALLVVAAGFLFVVTVGILFSTGLTRTLTRSVHDLYLGTKKVESGDFSHRIPIRSKDQLSELANSFNHMTERIERLIIDVKEKEKLESELEIARQVQSQLFPKEVPKLQSLELTGVCNPARVVSGDYYDFIPVDSHSTALVIGDISGKGISAALLMASVQSSLHAQLSLGKNGGISTATLVARLNRQLYESTPPEKYATFYCGLYDDESGILAYTNAGHLAPILVRQQEILKLESNGMVVGMFPEFPYEQSVIQLQKGDLLTAFTDGITESENARGEQFGEERLTDLLVRHRDRPLDEIMRAVTDTIRDWASDIDKQDDITLLLGRRI